MKTAKELKEIAMEFNNSPEIIAERLVTVCEKKANEGRFTVTIDKLHDLRVVDILESKGFQVYREPFNNHQFIISWD